MKYKIKCVAPKVYCIEFDKMYDMAMTFLRCQEFYESPKFKGQRFTLIEFMAWYSKEWGGDCFTYASDWAGFNMPASIVKDCLLPVPIDFNIYDDAMLTIHNQCRKLCGSEDFYIIGVLKNHDAFDHELAHGFYYTVPEYKKAMDEALKELPSMQKKRIYKHLKKWGGYSSNVLKDEAQAYLATGFENLNINRKYLLPFIKIFKAQKKCNLLNTK